MGEPEGSQAGYVTVGGTSTSLFEDRKSRFYGFATHVTSEDEVVEFRHGIMREIPDASHYVSAYLLHRGGIAHYSDAKEPHGTAGMPVLTVIRHSGIEDVACVVARIFGGTLLGRGGLVRAYTQAAKLAIEAAHLVRKAPCRDVLAQVPYACYEPVSKALSAGGAQVLDAGFATDVTIEFRALSGDVDRLCALVTELSGGAAELMVGDERLELVDVATTSSDHIEPGAGNRI